MRSMVAVVVMVALLLAPCATAVAKPQALEVKPGTLSVTVKSHEGEALSDAEVKLLDADGKSALSATVDKDGKCELEKLEAGSYELVIADRAKVPFTVSDKAEVDTLLVVMPPPAKYAAGDAQKTMTMPTIVTFIIGTIAVGVGAYVVFHDGGDTHGKKAHE